MDKPYSSFIGISLMAVPFLYAISIFQDVCKTTLYPFLRNEYAIIVQSKNFREVSIFICRSDFLSSTRSFLLASTVIVQGQRYGSGLWKYSATLVSSVKKHIQCFKNYLDFFIKNQRLLFHDWYSPCFSFLPPKETLASPL